MSIINNKFLLNLNSFILYVYPISLIFSPFFSNFFVFIVGIYGLINIRNFETESIFKNKFVICFIIFWSFITLRSLFSDYVLFSLKSSFLFIKYLLFLIGFIYIVKKKKKFLENFIRFFLIIFIIIIFDAFIQFSVGKNLIGYSANLIENNRISGFFGDELILGSFITRFVFLILGIIYFTKIKIKNIYIYILIFLSFLCVLLSGERTALALNIMSIIFYFILTNTIDWKPKLKIIILIILTLTLLIKFNPKINHRMDMTLKDISSADNILLFTEGHGNHFKTAFNMYRDNIIFGQGANMFRKKCAEKKFFVEPYGCSTHPHNIYLQLLSETGIVGFMFLIYLFLNIIFFSFKQFYTKYFLKKKFLSEYEIAYLTCVLINFWPIAPTGNFFSSAFGNILIMPIIFIFLCERFRGFKLK